MEHSQRLQKLIDLTSTNEKSTYLHNELRLLKQEINISIIDVKIEALKQFNQ